MKFIADLHIHSRYSRACSPQLTLENIDAWCRVKGVDIVVCGDFTHPTWFAEIKNKLVPSKHEGLYALKPGLVPSFAPPIALPTKPTLFLMGTEVACIYRHNDKTRRVHNLIYAPTMEAAAMINAKLAARGCKLASDGRPILGMSSKELLKLILEVDPRCVLIPAHAWTPWFAIFGSMSGYDSITECFEELTPHIFAIETGVSSDPPMNWRVEALDTIALVSHSDIHSLPNLAREANVLEGEEKDLSYASIMDAIRNAAPARRLLLEVSPRTTLERSSGILHSEPKSRAVSSETVALDARVSNDSGQHELNTQATTVGPASFSSLQNSLAPHLPSSSPLSLEGRGQGEGGLHMLGTIEFFPDEGRYHFDGHRDCKVSLHPTETKKLGGRCPKCKKPVTVGVLSRVEALANHPEGRVPQGAPQFWSLVELDKIIAQAEGVKSRTSKAVDKKYWELVAKGGNELNILLNKSLEELATLTSPRIVEAIRRMRAKELTIAPGYDGEYGHVTIFQEEEKLSRKQTTLL